MIKRDKNKNKARSRNMTSTWEYSRSRNSKHRSTLEKATRLLKSHRQRGRRSTTIQSLLIEVELGDRTSKCRRNLKKGWTSRTTLSKGHGFLNNSRLKKTWREEIKSGKNKGGS